MTTAQNYHEGAIKAWETRRRNQQRQNQPCPLVAWRDAEAVGRLQAVAEECRANGASLGDVLKFVADGWLADGAQPKFVTGDLYAIMAERGCSPRAAVAVCQKQTWAYADRLGANPGVQEMEMLRQLRTHLSLVTKQYRNDVGRRRGVLPALVAAPDPLLDGPATR